MRKGFCKACYQYDKCTKPCAIVEAELYDVEHGKRQPKSGKRKQRHSMVPLVSLPAKQANRIEEYWYGDKYNDPKG